MAEQIGGPRTQSRLNALSIKTLRDQYLEDQLPGESAEE